MTHVVDIVPALIRRAGLEALRDVRAGLWSRAVRNNERLRLLWAVEPGSRPWPAHAEKCDGALYIPATLR